MKWKFDSCPPFEQIFDDLFVKTNTHMPSIPSDEFSFQATGSAEVSRLWNYQNSDTETGLKPVLEEFLSPLKEQLSPEDQVESEYRLSADPVSFVYLFRRNVIFVNRFLYGSL